MGISLFYHPEEAPWWVYLSFHHPEEAPWWVYPVIHLRGTLVGIYLVIHLRDTLVGIYRVIHPERDTLVGIPGYTP